MRVDHKTLQERFRHLPVKQDVAVYEFSLPMPMQKSTWKNPKPGAKWKLLYKLVLEGLEIP